MKTFVLRFRKVDGEIFNAIKNGKKTVETRANTIRYQNAQAEDFILCMWNGKKFKREIKSVSTHKTIESLLKKYKPGMILPGAKKADLIKMYSKFTDYKSKLPKVGIVAFNLK